MALSVPIGTQVSEMMKAAKVCRSIYDAFFSQYDNAPGRLRELGQLINTYAETLEENEEILKLRSRIHPGHKGLKQTLEECTDFLIKYKIVCDEDSHGAKRIAMKAVYALDQNHVAKLDRQLVRHAMPLAMYNSNLILYGTVRNSG
ncbi:hypothetical protein K432DRAFT_383218 [Lepidopterella palustris CBS 459.81]|uniref:Uncharacterized protein n=1 Tax=Lepidopterella palustris CBS 459.81 TaxID=1314670 RepID=A0A8E2E8B6_9PEZI|nr:hypothetical protein K432DRAFT_383218 [Lepidopterella palustris CBS 459.81]